SFAAERALVSELSGMLKAPREALVERVSDLSTNLKNAQKRIAQLESAQRESQVPTIADAAATVGGFVVASANLGEVSSADELRTVALAVRERLGSAAAVTVIAGQSKDRP